MLCNDRVDHFTCTMIMIASGMFSYNLELDVVLFVCLFVF